MRIRYKVVIVLVVTIGFLWLVKDVFSTVGINLLMGLFRHGSDNDISLISVPGKIIFNSDRPENALYCLENGRIEKFSDIGGIARFSGDGKRVLHSYKGGTFVIRDYATGNIERVIDIQKYKPRAVDWSPDGKKICFTADTMEGIRTFTNLFVYDIDTEEVKQLTFFQGDTPWGVTNPKWSPDGSQIAFECPKYIEKGGYKPISTFIINADGSGLRDLLSSSTISGGKDPSWSPDGKKIVFISHFDNEKYNDVFIINTDGTGLTRLTNDYWQDRNPVFSPDGKKICYVSPRHGDILFGSELFVVNIDGTGQARLTPPFKRKDPSPFRKWATDDYPQWSE